MFIHRVLNLGAGVRSTTVYLMACENLKAHLACLPLPWPKVGLVDVAAFGDTQDEPRIVYKHPTDKQLKTHEIIERIHMARITLRIVLAAFIVILAALLVAAFTNLGGPRIEWAFTTIDGLLAFCLHQIVRYLFPTKKSPQSEK